MNHLIILIFIKKKQESSQFFDIFTWDGSNLSFGIYAILFYPRREGNM